MPVSAYTKNGLERYVDSRLASDEAWLVVGASTAHSYCSVTRVFNLYVSKQFIEIAVKRLYSYLLAQTSFNAICLRLDTVLNLISKN